jgi:hypothetical protein
MEDKEKELAETGVKEEKKIVAPDYNKAMEEQYSAAQDELNRQNKIAQRQRRAAIFSDMADVWVDGLKLAGGLTVEKRDGESAMSKAAKRKEELAQRAGAMQAQYARDRWAAKENQYKADLEIEKLNQAAAKAAQDQANKDREHDLNVKKAEADKDYKNKYLELQAKELAQKGSGKTDETDYDELYLEAVQKDPELRAQVERDIFDEVGDPTGRKTSYWDAKPDMRKLVAKEFKRRESAGKYDKQSAEAKQPRVLIPRGRKEILDGAKNKKAMSWVNKGGTKKIESEW